jgi:hypothetical protein
MNVVEEHTTTYYYYRPNLLRGSWQNFGNFVTNQSITISMFIAARTFQSYISQF